MRDLIIVMSLILASHNGAARADNHLKETRYCSEPARNVDGSIRRNRTVVREFERLYPLPAGYKRDEWQIDHVIPLAESGCDAIRNMQWLPKTIKTCPGIDCKDRWERKGIYTTK